MNNRKSPTMGTSQFFIRTSNYNPHPEIPASTLTSAAIEETNLISGDAALMNWKNREVFGIIIDEPSEATPESVPSARANTDVPERFLTVHPAKDRSEERRVG